MSEEDKASLEFYSKLNKKLKMILNGEMSLEQYQSAVQLKIDLIIENEEARLNAKGKRLYHRPQKVY